MLRPLSPSQEILEHHCYVAGDYAAELAQWQHAAYAREHTRVFQLPFDAPVRRAH